eukprot:g27078.t1
MSIFTAAMIMVTSDRQRQHTEGTLAVPGYATKINTTGTRSAKEEHCKRSACVVLSRAVFSIRILPEGPVFSPNRLCAQASFRAVMQAGAASQRL